MITKNNIKFALLAAMVGCQACDDGLIYEQEHAPEHTGYTAKLTAHVTGADTWPDYYDVALATFGESDYSRSQTTVHPDTEGNVTLLLYNIGNDVRTVEFCVTNTLRRRVLTFASADVSSAVDDTIYLDAGEVDASMYAAIQHDVFNNTCAQCHGLSTTAAAAPETFAVPVRSRLAADLMMVVKVIFCLLYVEIRHYIFYVPFHDFHSHRAEDYAYRHRNFLHAVHADSEVAYEFRDGNGVQHISAFRIPYLYRCFILLRESQDMVFQYVGLAVIGVVMYFGYHLASFIHGRIVEEVRPCRYSGMCDGESVHGFSVFPERTFESLEVDIHVNVRTFKMAGAFDILQCFRYGHLDVAEIQFVRAGKSVFRAEPYRFSHPGFIVDGMYVRPFCSIAPAYYPVAAWSEVHPDTLKFSKRGFVEGIFGDK